MPKRKKTPPINKFLIPAVVFVLLLIGVIATTVLALSNQDWRKQAASLPSELSTGPTTSEVCDGLGEFVKLTFDELQSTSNTNNVGEGGPINNPYTNKGITFSPNTNLWIDNPWGTDIWTDPRLAGPSSRPNGICGGAPYVGSYGCQPHNLILTFDKPVPLFEVYGISGPAGIYLPAGVKVTAYDSNGRIIEQQETGTADMHKRFRFAYPDARIKSVHLGGNAGGVYVWDDVVYCRQNNPSATPVSTTPTPTPTPTPVTSCHELPADIVLVLDRSDSMNKRESLRTKLQWAKLAAANFVDTVVNGLSTHEIRIGVVSFGQEFNHRNSRLNAQVIQPLTSNSQEIKTAVNNLSSSSSGTCISCGIDLANQLLEDSPNNRFIVLLSDGHATYTTNRTVNDSKAGQEAINYALTGKNMGISFYSAQFGPYGIYDSYKGTVNMKAIASTPAHYFYKPTVKEWSSTLGDIGRKFCLPQAQ